MTKLLWRAWLPVLILVLWEIAGRAGWLDPLFFPFPSRVGQAFGAQLKSGEWGNVVRETLTRTGLGFGIGVIAGLAAGICMGLWSPVRRSIDWMLSALVSSPKITILPLLILSLGVGELPRLLLVALATFAIVTLQTADAVRHVPAAFVDMGRNYGAKGLSLLRWVYLPAIIPPALSAMRIGAGRALGVSVSVELVTGSGGLGHMIWRGWQAFATERVYVGVLTTAFLGAAVHLAGGLIERRIVTWKKT